MTDGQCMCGAVTVRVAKLADGLSACHCQMCRRWTGAAFVALHADGDDVSWTGPVKTYASSDWASRGWCDVCGSTLFYRIEQDGSYGLAAGLFDGAAGQRLSMEGYIDEKPAGYAFAGDHKTLTRAQTLHYFGISEGE